jgi:hypothetical protein
MARWWPSSTKGGGNRPVNQKGLNTDGLSDKEARLLAWFALWWWRSLRWTAEAAVSTWALPELK